MLHADNWTPVLLAIILVAIAACVVAPKRTPAPTQTPFQVTTTVPSPTPTAAPIHSTTLTPSSTQPPTSTPVPIPAPPLSIPKPPDRDLYELARSLLLKTKDPIPRLVIRESEVYQKGHLETFWLIDILDKKVYSSEATLQLASPRAYWYVEKGLKVSQEDLERAARIFEEDIYPRVTAVFGSVQDPGVDNGPRLTILHAALRGVAGYYSAVDEYPTTVHQYSNQRKMIYINADSLRVGSSSYLATIAHELQHAIHRNGDRGEETWVNEGLSEVAVKVAGYRPESMGVFLRSPTLSLLHWPLEPESSVPHYGAVLLFFDYLASHYGDYSNLKLLVNESDDDIEGINAYLARLGHQVTFREVFKDWVVANFLDEASGRYSYPGERVQVRVKTFLNKFGERTSSIPQYSAEYIEIDIGKGDVKLRFQGQKETPILPVPANGGHCWWSNRGDAISSTLTRSIDLSSVNKATLKFRLWFDTEEDWDYGYVQVSTDGGSTWDILKGPRTSPRNPVGNSFGFGYTGRASTWIQESIDLSPYAGRQVLLRLHYVTDDAVNGTGLCFDDIAIPEINFIDDAEHDAGWQAEGFIRIDNRVPQEFIIQIVEMGGENRVREVVLDGDNRGEIIIKNLEKLDRVVVVVAALATATLQPAQYKLVLEPSS